MACFCSFTLKEVCYQGGKKKRKGFLESSPKQKQGVLFHQCRRKLDDVVNIMGVLCAL